MSAIFCCSDVRPYKNSRPSHETNFQYFLSWGSFHKESSVLDISNIEPVDYAYVVQVVRQVNFGPLEGKRYFITTTGEPAQFVEIDEKWLIDASLLGTWDIRQRNDLG
jgi:hypothetical protein